MEQLNRVELRGIVGSVKVSKICGHEHARMTVATNLAYKDMDGCPVIETTWHNVTAFEGKDICDLGSIGRGDRVEVVGRIRNQRFTSESGTDVTTSEILASRITRLSSEEQFQYQF